MKFIEVAARALAFLHTFIFALSSGGCRGGPPVFILGKK